MAENKKIMIVGPPGAGKTTLKKVFFDMANPLNLLKNSLEPTRGMNSSIFSLFDSNIGIFDLAGQENENWFKKDKEVFNEANMIICVLDINNYLKDIFNFLNNLIDIHKELKLRDCDIVILLHKIDLIDRLYLQHKLKAIDDFIKNKLEIDFELIIYSTSIAKDYFFETYDIISEIFHKVIKHKSILTNKSIFQDFKMDLQIILQYDDLKKYRAIDLFHDLELSVKDANLHLKRLEKLGFIEFLENYQNFQLTERASFFKSGLKGKKLNDKDSKVNKILESLFIFSNLNQKKN